MNTKYKIHPALIPIIIFFLLIPSTLFAWSGKVVNVSDGDTAKIIRSDTGEQIKVRFAGIDSPEKKQAYGQAARKYVNELIAGKTVRVEPVGEDRYGRTVGYIWLNDKEINFKIVAAGYAWMYRQYAPKPKNRAEDITMLKHQLKFVKLVYGKTQIQLHLGNGVKQNDQVAKKVLPEVVQMSWSGNIMAILNQGYFISLDAGIMIVKIAQRDLVAEKRRSGRGLGLVGCVVILDLIELASIGRNKKGEK